MGFGPDQGKVELLLQQFLPRESKILKLNTWNMISLGEIEGLMGYFISRQNIGVSEVWEGNWGILKER